MNLLQWLFIIGFVFIWIWPPLAIICGVLIVILLLGLKR